MWFFRYIIEGMQVSIGRAGLCMVYVKILSKDPLVLILKDQESVWMLLLKSRNGN